MPILSKHTRTRLALLGFNVSPSHRVSCDACDALVINGVPCHEHHCPNMMHECNGCDTIIPATQRYCEECNS